MSFNGFMNMHTKQCTRQNSKQLMYNVHCDWLITHAVRMQCLIPIQCQQSECVCVYYCILETAAIQPNNCWPVLKTINSI